MQTSCRRLLCDDAALSLTFPLPPCCSIAVLVHLAINLALAPANPGLCSSPVLQHPPMQRLTRRAAQLLALMGRFAPPRPGTTLSALLPPGPESCVFTLSFLQLSLGLAAPALLQAAAEAAAFERHQRQRHAAGLAKEAGLRASVYEMLRAFTAGLSWPAALVLALGCLSLLVQCTTLLVSIAGQAA